MANAKEVAGKVVFCLCGPIGSLCCFILSIWGIVMLFLLGGFYYIESAVLFEDFHESVHHSHGYIEGIYYYDTSDVTSAYQNAAYTCWGAAVIYIFFLLLSGSFIGVNIWRKKN